MDLTPGGVDLILSLLGLPVLPLQVLAGEGGGGGRDPRALLHRRGQDHLVAHTALLSLLGLGSRID